MKGVIFTEFIELVEEKFGLDVVDNMFFKANDEGIYTSVGSYDHKRLVQLIIQLSKLTNISTESLQETFGESLFENLINSIPSGINYQKFDSTFSLIRQVETLIHVEVKKLYPNTSPPQFYFISETASEMVFDYRSARCMSHVCFGLIKGCAKYFNETVDVTYENQTANGDHVRFYLEVR
ncbi:heme NO-binding domain-containing protein [Vibrio sagamiensis]|uniref:Guanylate cyclase n=1 Tax=Vibrio sagamiensis NBRC 104589 TaxID=1219064 RepID=A0A511QB56_9VIBR|nr:heme NO-binding domain-containing protein [Vibrio sagamiensis]GEM74488.1 guanylate cyclase [Vibrio sagamiensis NBRC 104589]